MAVPALLTPAKPRRRWLGVVIALIVVVILTIALLSIITTTHSYGFSLAPCSGGSGEIGGEVRQFPNDASVVVHWYEPDGSQVTFVIQENATALYDQTTSSGSYSFTANGQQVTFSAASPEIFCTAADVQVYGHWTVPILVL
jgi:hypothetical protein